jgi:FkbM family methyltransferase
VTAVKSLAQGVLRRAGLYQRVKASHAYDLYWRVADRRLIRRFQGEVEFYRHVLEGFRPGDLVFDIGANDGTKTAVFLKLGARVIAVEPDEQNQEIIRQKYLTWRFKPKSVVIVDKAVSERESVQTMWIDAPGSAMNTLSPKWVATLRGDETRFGHKLDFAARKSIHTIALEQLMSTYGRPFYVKVDVEGFEPSVLRGMARRVPYLSFEANLPEFEAEAVECVDLLRRIAPDGQFNFTASCERGLALDRWLDTSAFLETIAACSDRSIEVFWRTSLRRE